MRLPSRIDGAISASLIFFTVPQFLCHLLQTSNATRHGPPHTGRSLRSAEADDTTAAEDGPDDESSWLCRISGEWAACGKREYNDSGGNTHLDMYCPNDHCCSKIACAYGRCGSWCTSSWALCSSRIVYHSEYSYGNCNCEQFGAECDVNAECIHRNAQEGGVFCRCKEGYWGDGRTCEIDLCASNPCGAGVCEGTGEQYRCLCPESHKLVTIGGYETCQEKIDYCSAKPCGPDAMVKGCVNTDDGYQCTCAQGYEVQNNRCVEVDLCASSPCGPPEGVHSCTTEREPKLLHHCQCRAGYDLRVLPDGETEICAKNWCYGDPCGPADHVSSCSSSATGYSCLCKEGYLTSTNEEDKEVCVRQDICKQAPCGPPDAVKECYSEGSSYRCRCQLGYTETISDGSRQCTLGDPCHLGVCGPPDAVKECSTDGSSYSCTCNVGYTEVLKEGQRTCVSEEECTSRCGAREAVKSCELLAQGEVKCTCNAGYVRKYGVGKCEKGDPCSVHPCGEHEAVRSCTPTGSTYTCQCNEGFTRRIRDDGSQVCASASSCAGQPCGSPAIAEACISTGNSYTCKCREGFVQSLVNGQPRCTPDDREHGEQQSGDNGKQENQNSGISVKAAAGGVVGVLLLIGAVGSAVAYKRRRATRESDDADTDDFEVDQPLLAPSSGLLGGISSQAWADSPSPSTPAASAQVNTW